MSSSDGDTKGPRVILVYASGVHGEIGMDGKLPWQGKYPMDMGHFKQLTSRSMPGTRNVVIMGRLTWESLPKKWRPLAGRMNVVISKRMYDEAKESYYHTGVEDLWVFPSVEEAVKKIQEVQRPWGFSTIFIIGGRGVYEEALQKDLVQEVYHTIIPHRYPKATVMMPLLWTEKPFFEHSSTTFNDPDGQITMRHLSVDDPMTLKKTKAPPSSTTAKKQKTLD